MGELSQLSVKMQFFNLLLLTGAAFAKPSMRGADFGDYPFDGSMLADTVHSCTAGTPAGDVLEEAYNGCGQGDFQCFLGAMGWMDASGMCSTTSSWMTS